MSTKAKSASKKPVRIRANSPEPQQNKAVSKGRLSESEDSRGLRHINQVNHASTLDLDSNAFNLLLFLLVRPDTNRVITSVWSRHLEGRYMSMDRQPMIYFRITLGIALGYSRIQLAELVGGGWTIPINCFVKLGYAATRKYLSRDYEDLILTAKGQRLYNDFIKSILAHIDTIPEPKNNNR
jgi:hypothetical protein